MFVTLDEYYNHLYQLLDEKPTKVYISTFGVYAGVLETGKDLHQLGGKYHNEIHVLFDRLKEIEEVKLLVGLPFFKSCKGRNEICQDCVNQLGKQYARLNKHTEQWPNFQWHYYSDLHLKATLFVYKDKPMRAVIGGRNFTDSDWADISFEMPLDLVKPLEKVFKDVWKKSTAITEVSLATALESKFSNLV